MWVSNRMAILVLEGMAVEYVGVLGGMNEEDPYCEDIMRKIAAIDILLAGFGNKQNIVLTAGAKMGKEVADETERTN